MGELVEALALAGYPLDRPYEKLADMRVRCHSNVKCIKDGYLEIGTAFNERTFSNRVFNKQDDSLVSWSLPSFCSRPQISMDELTACASPEASALFGEIEHELQRAQKMGRSLNPLAKPVIQEMLDYCGWVISCKLPRLRYELEILKFDNGTFIPPEKVYGSCSREQFDRLQKNCTIVFGAEYGCNLALTEEEGVMSGRNTSSSAICSIAMQELLVGEIDWVAAGISVGAGIADDLADQAMEDGNILSALLFQMTSYGAQGAGLAWCFSAVDRQCGR